jgi:hypothetical protein
MKYLMLVFVLSGCATHVTPGGTSYYWIAPLPSTGGPALTTTGVTVTQVTVNGTGYAIIGGRGR